MMQIQSIARDGQVVILARALRTFGYGFTSVLLGVVLVDTGVPTMQIGILFAVAALGSVTWSFILGICADRIGRKRSLVVSALLMVGTGCTFAFTRYYPLLLIAAFCGTISPSTNDNTPFSGIEQAILAQSSPPKRHSTLFTFYNLVAQFAGALGSVLVGLPDLLSHVGVDTSTGVRCLFVLYSGLAGSIGVLFLQLSPAIEIQKRKSLLGVTKAANQEKPSVLKTLPRPRKRNNASKGHQRILQLSSLFALDAFAGGLVVQSILTVWLHERFGVSLSSLGWFFSGMNLLTALSLMAAPRLTRRFGLLKTMVGPHTVSNIFLLLVPFMPTFPLAALFLLMRQSLTKLDVPARQAYVMALVSPEERTAAASYTTVARSVAVSASPLLSGLMLSGSMLVLGLPVLMASWLELSYDVTLWSLFRRVPLYRAAREKSLHLPQFLPLHFPRKTASFQCQSSQLLHSTTSVQRESEEEQLVLSSRLAMRENVSNGDHPGSPHSSDTAMWTNPYLAGVRLRQRDLRDEE